MSENTAAGVTLSIGTTQAATSIAEFDTDTYTEVGLIEDPGEFGDQVNSVTFTALSDRRTRKYKGSRDAGDQSLTIAFDPDDAGQQALKTALDDNSSDDYNIKIELDDMPSGGTNGTTFYYRGKIMSRRIQPGNADNVVRATVTIGINSDVYEKAAA